MRDSPFVTAWLRLAFTHKVGPRTFSKLIKKFKSPITALDNISDIKRRYKLELKPPSVSEIEDCILKCHDFGGEIILSCDDLYPDLLKEIEGFPPLLFVKGNTQLLSKNKISIVGTRNSSINGEKITKKIASELGKNGLVIVSGLARGIDAVAHYSSLETGTIGVIASGINCIYPKENEKLQHLLYEKGLVISENQMDVLPISKNFPRRNRIISGISNGVLVTEAMQNSGTMITANYALEQGRDVFAIPGSPMDPRAYGTNSLIKNGAILVRDAEDILSELQFIQRNNIGLDKYFAVCTDDAKIPLSSQEKLLSKLSIAPTDIEELFNNFQISVSEFNQILIELEMMGKIVRRGNKLSLT